MSITPEILDAMVASGCTADQIATVVKAAMGTRSTGAERQARYRARKASQSVTSDVTSVTVTDNPSPKKERSPTPPKEKTTPSSSETIVSSVVGSGRAGDLSEFKAELSAGLDAERIEAIIKHRRSKKGQITGHAARLFRRDAEECGLSLIEAVDTCISRNWITVKPEYLRDKHSPRLTSPPAPPRKVTQGNMWLEEARSLGIIGNDTHDTTGLLAEGYEGRTGPSPDTARCLVIAASR